MNSKLFGLFAFGVFALVLAMGAVSATTLTEWPLTTDEVATTVATNLNAGNLTFGSTLTNTGFNATNGANATGWNTASIGSNDYYQITLTALSGFNFNINSVSFTQISSDPTTDMSFDVNWSKDNFATSTNIVSAEVSTTTSTLSSTTTNINLNGGETLTLRIFGYNSDNSLTETFSVKNLNILGAVTSVVSTPPEIASCTSNPGLLEVKKIDFTNNGMQNKEFGEDDEWFLLETIDVEIEIENDGKNDVDDVSIEWGLWDTKNSVWVVDFDEADEVNIKDGDEEVLTVSFTLDDDLDVDLDELEDGNHYRLYVKASGTVDDGLDTPPTCASDFEPATIVVESNFVVLDNFEAPETVSCGANVEVSALVWNIGDRDQDEVSVIVTNTELGINDEILVGDIDKFDSQRVSFTFTVPRDAQEKTYGIRMQVEDEDGDVYENDFNDDLSDFTLLLDVEGSCTGSVAPVTITAALVSDARAGQDMVVKATVVNTGSSSATYTLSSAGHGQWASSFTVVPSTLTLAAGQSGEATFTFKVNKDVSGEQSFNIELVSGNQVTTQPVSVMIESAGFFSSITGGAIGNNGWVWGLGALNVLLVVVIILVALRVMRK